jgi:hypothetical protein
MSKRDSYLTEILKMPETTIGDMIQDLNNGKPGVFHTVYQHDDWCRTLVTGRGTDCNCNPTISMHRHTDLA